MSMIKLIHHVNIQTADRARTREWYERTLGCVLLDRGPALNKRQLQLRIGSGEMHFSEVPEGTQVCVGHFAVEVADWDGMMAHLEKEGVTHNRVPPGSRGNLGGSDPNFGNREDSGEFFTYIHDPDGNMIELVHHPLGWQDSKGDKVEIPHSAEWMGVAQKAGWVASEYEKAKASA